MARGKGKGNAGIVNKPVTGTGANDVLTGSAAIINGGDGNDQITGSDLVERINAGDGDDFIFGGGGDDTIFGNDGTDTAAYSGSLQDAVLEAGKGNSYSLTSADGGTDTLKHIEFIQFDDFTYEIGVNNGVFTRADSAATDEDTAITIDALANDFDFEGDSYSVTSFDTVSANGAAVSLVNGEFVYDSSAAATIQAMDDGESMTDTFTYTVTDAAGNVSTETVSVDVAGVSDSVIIDFDSGSNTLISDGWNVKTGTYSEDGFTIEWSSQYSGYWSAGTSDAIIDSDSDGDQELGYFDKDLWLPGYTQIEATLSKDDGSTFSLADFNLENIGGAQSEEISLVYSSWDPVTQNFISLTAYQTYSQTDYFRTNDIWFLRSSTWNPVDGSGSYFGTTTDTEVVASLFSDIDYLDIHLSSNDYLYNYYQPNLGIGIDNIEIA